MAAPGRRGGAAAVQSRVHWLPSHSHVSFSSPSAYGWMWSPPNRPVRPRWASNAIEAMKRGWGAVAVSIGVQLVPSHSHVSATRPDASAPPNNTVRPRVGSKARAGPRRGVGDAAGCIWAQTVPWYAQAPPSMPLPSPPNSTIRLRTESNAIPAHTRAGGDVAGLFCVQLTPSHSHVEELVPVLSEPPNSTDTPRKLS